MTNFADVAERLRGIAAAGLKYSDSPYDRERFESVQTIAMELLAAAAGVDLSTIEPLRSSTFAHPTPFTGADAFVLDEDEQLLLIRRSDSGLWAMPGGLSDTGETPARTAEREALEETGVAVEAVALAGVFDSRYSRSRVSQHLYHFVFACRPTDARQHKPSHPWESLETRWFALDDLPDEMEPGHAFRLPIVREVWRGARPAYFDTGAR